MTLDEPFIPEQQALQGDIDAAEKAVLRLGDGEPRATFARRMIQAARQQPLVKPAAWEVLKVAWRSREANYLLRQHLRPEGVSEAFAYLAPSSGVTTNVELMLYRGVRIAPAMMNQNSRWWYGASWTTSVEMASFFACDYWMNQGDGQPAVAQIQVNGGAIAFHMDDGEDEYIPSPTTMRQLADPSYAYGFLGLRVQGRRGYKAAIISPQDVERWREASANRTR